jgi:class 3 adenylate cyclase/tetratricopeptide (TPR) repeat protein
MVGEGRRIVTVLFADVSGFTAMSERLDPEQVTVIMNEFFKALVDPIYAYGGVVDKFIGDAVMAVFGAPIAHEDDAVRALLAAWGMQERARHVARSLYDRVGVQVQIRVGLNTGLAVYSSVGGQQKLERTVIGDTVNLAARMETAAKPGQILLTADTREAAGDAFRFRELPAVAVKGKSEPVNVFEIVGLGTGVPVGKRDHPEVFVGRRMEWAMLESAFRGAIAGRPQFTLITGDPGSGKSALAARFLTFAAARGATVVRTRAQSFFQTTGGDLVKALLQNLLQIPVDAAADTARERIAQALSGPFPDDSRAVDLIGSLIGLAPADPGLATLDPKALRHGAWEALAEWLVVMARDSVLVVSVSDLHWADAGSLEWLDTLCWSLSQAQGATVMVLGQHRTGEIASLPGLDAPIETTHVALRPLGLTEARELGMALLLAGDKLPDGKPTKEQSALLERAVARADGNPFYLTELILASHGREEAALPTSVRGAVAARLDALAPPLRETLQVMAVAGRRCDPRLLAEVVEQDVERELAELIRLRYLRPLPDGQVEFSQTVVHETALESLLIAHRRELHRRMGVAIEHRARVGTTLGSLGAILAHHFTQAEDPARAARYHFIAGRQARAGFSNAAARNHLAKALEWRRKAGDAPDIPPVADILLDLANVERSLSDYQAALAHLDELAAVRPDTPASKRERAETLYRMGDLSKSLALFKEASQSQDEAPIEAALALAGAANVLRLRGDYRQAIGMAQHAQRALETLRRPGEAALALSVAGICHHRTGRYAESEAVHGEALRLREVAGDLEGAARSHLNLGIALTAQKRWDEAQNHHSKALVVFRKLGDRRMIAQSLTNLGDLHLEKGDTDLAERHFRESLKISRHLGDIDTSIANLGSLAEIAVGRMDSGAALEMVNEVLDLMGRSGHGEHAPAIYAIRGRALGQAGDAPGARSAFAEARRRAEEAGNTAFVSTIDTWVADLARSC